VLRKNLQKGDPTDGLENGRAGSARRVSAAYHEDRPASGQYRGLPGWVDRKVGLLPAILPSVNRDDFEIWLQRYGAAWEAQDAGAFVALFTGDCRYHWTPFQEPQRGHQELTAVVSAAFTRQREVEFGAEVLGFTDRGEGLAHWWCLFRRPGKDHRVKLDGIFQVELDEQGLCPVFREWWHSDEGGV